MFGQDQERLVPQSDSDIDLVEDCAPDRHIRAARTSSGRPGSASEHEYGWQILPVGGSRGHNMRIDITCGLCEPFYAHLLSMMALHPR
jgi:hypothetical protein